MVSECNRLCSLKMCVSRNDSCLTFFVWKKSDCTLSKDEVKNTLEKLPVVGDAAVKGIVGVKKFLKDRLYQSNMFEDMGFNYMGPIDGHDLDALRDAFKGAKTIDGPVILHVRTMKGKGYLPAEENPSKFHGIGSFDRNTGETPAGGTNFSAEFGKALCTFAEQDEHIVAITAAMALGTGLEEYASGSRSGSSTSASRRSSR